MRQRGAGGAGVTLGTIVIIFCAATGVANAASKLAIIKTVRMFFPFLGAAAGFLFLVRRLLHDLALVILEICSIPAPELLLAPAIVTQGR
jgi:hypothetical protein